jgi:uncharacterized RDD family membrane protein YckC
MPKGVCIYCNSSLNISDEIVECTTCEAVMRVIDWNPFELELIKPGAVDAESLPPQTEQDLNKYHTGGRRFIAGFVDGLVLMPIGLIDSWVLDPSHQPILMAVWLLISNSAAWVYSVLMHGHYGQTIGKMVCHVEVLDISEQRMTMRQAFLRDSVIIVISVASLMVSLYLVLAGSESNSIRFAILQLVIESAALIWFMAEMVTLLTNEKRRALHDFIAGTVVVRSKSQSQVQDGPTVI